MGTAYFSVIDQFAERSLNLFGDALYVPLAHRGIVTAEYIPCVTPVGHATLSTGTLPTIHGIIGRRWCSREGNKFQHVDIERFQGLMDIRAPLEFAHERYLVQHNLCNQFGSDWMCVVASAKPFVSFMLGGQRADVIIYPSRNRASGRWDIVFQRNPYPTSDPTNGFTTDQHEGIRDSFAELLQDIGMAPTRKLVRTADLGWDRQRGCHTFSIPYFTPSPISALAVDRFYSRVIQVIVDDAHQMMDHVTNNSLIIQSFFSNDYIGHMFGCNSPLYDTNLLQLGSIINSLMAHLTPSFDRPLWLITSDHGGRAVNQELHLAAHREQTSHVLYSHTGLHSKCPGTAIPQGKVIECADLAYIYEMTSTPAQQNVLRRNDYFFDGCNRQPITLDYNIFANSFNNNNRPDQIEVPHADMYFSKRHLDPTMLGSHGASHISAQMPNTSKGRFEEDFRIPILVSELLNSQDSLTISRHDRDKKFIYKFV